MNQIGRMFSLWLQRLKCEKKIDEEATEKWKEKKWNDNQKVKKNRKQKKPPSTDLTRFIYT